MLRNPLVGVILMAACAHMPGPAAVPLYDCRLALEPLLAELRQAGGDPAHVIHVSSAADLTRLQAGARYKFAVTADGKMAIAPEPADAPKNLYSHPILADGGPVRTAGGIRVDREGGRVLKVVVDPGSTSFCPSTGSLQAALDALIALGISPEVLRVDNKPPVCVDTGASASMTPAPPAQAPAPASAAPEPPSRYGALMVEVGHRFETLGRAERAGRYDLAEFELGELGEVFEEDLPHAEPPKENKGRVDLNGLADAFQKTHPPELEVALKKRDRTAFAAAFARASVTCNGCHKASGHEYLEISSEPGAAVPKLDPVAPTRRR